MRVKRKRNNEDIKNYTVKDLIMIHQNNSFFEKAILEIMNENKLTYNQILMILISGECSGIQINELAFCFGGAQSNVSSLCKSLEQRGLVDRHRENSDERRVSVSLTASGAKVRDSILEHISMPLTQQYLQENEQEMKAWFNKN